MSNLVLELKQGEMMIVNGAVIRFRTRARIELGTQARFMFGKQIMRQEDAATPAQKIYYDLQMAYVGPEDTRAASAAAARQRIESLMAAAPEAARPALQETITLIERAEIFEALKHVRQLTRD